MSSAGSAAGGGRRQRSFLWLQGLGCGAVLMVSPAAVLLGALLLLPVALVAALDREPGLPLTRAVLCWTLIGMAEPVLRFCLGGASFAALGDLVSTPIYFVEAWVAAGAGWLVAELVPLAIGWWLAAALRRQVAALEARRDELLAEWQAD